MNELNPLRAYAWCKVPNFGDRLTALILRRRGLRVVEYQNADSANLLGTGSVLHHVQRTWRGFVLGSGTLYNRLTHRLPLAEVFAVRGPMTARLLGLDVPLGDLGLLAVDFEELPEPDVEVGFVPHWADSQLRRMPDAIDVGAGPEEVLRRIARCKRIKSSSLHGVIVADAIGIPATPLTFAKAPAEGGDWKWLDYAASLGISHAWGGERVAPAERVAELQHGLRQAVARLKAVQSAQSVQ